MGLERIERSFEEFCSLLEQCCRDPSDTPRIKDAYDRLARLRNRVKKECNSLDPTARDSLKKVFWKNHFIVSVLGTARVIAHHTRVNTDNAFMYDVNDVSFEINCLSTEGAVIPRNRVQLPDPYGTLHDVDHIMNLTKAKERIAKALTRARGE